MIYLISPALFAVSISACIYNSIQALTALPRTAASILYCLCVLGFKYNIYFLRIPGISRPAAASSSGGAGRSSSGIPGSAQGGRTGKSSVSPAASFLTRSSNAALRAAAASLFCFIYNYIHYILVACQWDINTYRPVSFIFPRRGFRPLTRKGKALFCQGPKRTYIDKKGK